MSLAFVCFVLGFLLGAAFYAALIEYHLRKIRREAPPPPPPPPPDRTVN